MVSPLCRGRSMANVTMCSPYDFFLYMEGDMAIPAETFSFWTKHADKLFERGYLLLPYRAENNIEERLILSDAFERGGIRNTMPFIDPEGGAELYDNRTDRTYLRPYNPYSASFMMTRAQFA